jgi:hypothetical protein
VQVRSREESLISREIPWAKLMIERLKDKPFLVRAISELNGHMRFVVPMLSSRDAAVSGAVQHPKIDIRLH